MPAAHDAGPYPGLVAFDVADAAAFFGRVDDVKACRAILDRTGVLAVVGPPGSGKTSLVRAGLVPGLLADGYAVRLATSGLSPGPGLTTDPLAADATAAGSGNIAAPECLIVDQLEDVLTGGASPYEQAAHLGAISAASRRGLVVVVVRADDVGALSGDRRTARLVERGLYLLGPLRGEALAEAIEAPAQMAGLHFEAGLADAVHHDADGSAAGLPLLAHALRSVWEQRDGRTLTLAAYRRIGGVRGAVATSAESVYADTPERDRPVLRDLLLRLVAPGPGEARRASVPYRAAAAGPIRARLVERLLAEGLLVRRGDDVELAHDTVVTAWPRLRSWVEDDLDGLRVRHHLTVASADWEGLGRPDSELYRGVRLARAVEWYQRERPALPRSERAFLGAAEARAAAERRDADGRLRAEAAAGRRWRAVAAGVVALLLLVVVAAALVARHGSRAERAAAVAEARRVGAQALTTHAVDRALLLAVEAVGRHDSVDTRATLLQTIARHPYLAGTVRANGPLSAVAVAPDDSVVAVGGQSVGLVLYDAESRRRQAHVAVPVRRLAFSPDGTTIAVVTARPPAGTAGRTPAPVVLVDARTGALRDVPPGIPAEPATSVAFSGRRLLAGFDHGHASGVSARGALDSTVVTWDLETGTMRRTTVAGTEPSLFVDPAGSRAYIGTERPGGRSWLTVVELSTGVVAHEGPLAARPVAISADGTTLAGIGDGEVALFDTETLAERARVATHHPLAGAGALRADGDLLVSVGSDGAVTLWGAGAALGPQPAEPERWPQVTELTAHTGAVSGVALSQDAATLYTVSTDGLLLVWDLVGERRLVALDPAAAVTERPRPSLRQTEQGIEVYAPETRLAVRAPVPFTGAVRAMVASPDWERAAVLTTDRNIVLVDFARSVIGGSLKVAWTPTGAAFSEDGTRLAVTGSAGEVGLVDVEASEWLTLPVPAHRGEVRSVGWSADGGLFATGGVDGRLGLWDGVDGRSYGLIEIGAGPVPVTVHFAGHDVVIVADQAYRLDTRLTSWIEFACRAVGRELTASEWAAAIGEGPPRESCAEAGAGLD